MNGTPRLGNRIVFSFQVKRYWSMLKFDPVSYSESLEERMRKKRVASNVPIVAMN